MYVIIGCIKGDFVWASNGIYFVCCFLSLSPRAFESEKSKESSQKIESLHVLATIAAFSQKKRRNPDQNQHFALILAKPFIERISTRFSFDCNKMIFATTFHYAFPTDFSIIRSIAHKDAHSFNSIENPNAHNLFCFGFSLKIPKKATTNKEGKRFKEKKKV